MHCIAQIVGDQNIYTVISIIAGGLISYFTAKLPVKALTKKVAELEAINIQQNNTIAVQGNTIAKQGARIAELEASVVDHRDGHRKAVRELDSLSQRLSDAHMWLIHYRDALGRRLDGDDTPDVPRSVTMAATAAR